jgi:predicted permease
MVATHDRRPLSARSTNELTMELAINTILLIGLSVFTTIFAWHRYQEGSYGIFWVCAFLAVCVLIRWGFGVMRYANELHRRRRA